jgi:hypothetical protein
MDFPVFTAHGALGAFDELIFLGVAGLFLAMMGISWFRSRNLEPELEETDAAPEQSSDRFKLD